MGRFPEGARIMTLERFNAILFCAKSHDLKYDCLREGEAVEMALIIEQQRVALAKAKASIKEWRTDDQLGYDSTIELLCEMEAEFDEALALVKP